MKILFVVSHELYLRNFSGVLKELVSRGHRVQLAFTARRHIEQKGIDELLAAANISIVEWSDRGGWWAPTADVLRGIADYIHALDPVFDDSLKMRRRIAGRIPRPMRSALALLARDQHRRRRLASFFEWLEWSLPCDATVTRWLDALRPDVLVISPLIDMNYAQFDVLKAARQRALPSIYMVASWDNLTMKGKVQIVADGQIVWNRFQVEEAKTLHGIDPEKITVTGAQLYDQWFEMTVSQDRHAFCAAAGGLDASSPILLYVGSSPYICPDEVTFFREWLARLRADADPLLCEANVLVRPHPQHAAQWADFAIPSAESGRLAIFPKSGEMPVAEEQKQLYFNTLWHADALVGINTSAFLEAGILGRRTFTFRNTYFQETQEGTLHFAYVAESGLLQIAADIDGHMRDLAFEVAGRGEAGRTRFPFIGEFLRPNGLDRPVAPDVAAAIERVGAAATLCRSAARGGVLGRILLWPLTALVMQPRHMAREKKRARKLREQAQAATL